MCHRLIRWISGLVEKNVKSVDVEERVSIGKEHGRLVAVRVSVCVQLGGRRLVTKNFAKYTHPATLVNVCVFRGLHRLTGDEERRLATCEERETLPSLVR